MLTFACTSTQRKHWSRGTSNRMWDGGRNTQWSPDFSFGRLPTTVFLFKHGSVGGFLWWICVMWVFFGVRNAMINYKIQALIHESVLFSMGFTVRRFVETSQVVQRFHNQLATCRQHDIESRELPPKKSESHGGDARKFPRNLALTKTWRFFVNKRCQMFFG